MDEPRVRHPRPHPDLGHLNLQAGYFGAVGSRPAPRTRCTTTSTGRPSPTPPRARCGRWTPPTPIQATVSPDITLTDAPATARALGSTDAAVQPVTLVDPPGGTVYAWGAADAPVQPVTLADATLGVARAVAATTRCRAPTASTPAGGRPRPGHRGRRPRTGRRSVLWSSTLGWGWRARSGRCRSTRSASVTVSRSASPSSTRLVGSPSVRRRGGRRGRRDRRRPVQPPDSAGVGRLHPGPAWAAGFDGGGDDR